MPCWLVFCRQGFALLGLQLGFRVGSFHPWCMLWIWLLRILGGLLELTLLMLFSLEELEDFELVELEAARRESDKTKTPLHLGFRGLKFPNCRLHVGIQRSGVFVDSKRRRVDRGVFCPQTWQNDRSVGRTPGRLMTYVVGIHTLSRRRNGRWIQLRLRIRCISQRRNFYPEFPETSPQETYTSNDIFRQKKLTVSGNKKPSSVPHAKQAQA